MLSDKIKSVIDLLNPQTGKILRKHEIEEKYFIAIDEETVTQLHFILKSAYKSISLDYEHQATIDLPSRPLLIRIANMTNKGCSMYSKLLKKKATATTTLSG